MGKAGRREKGARGHARRLWSSAGSGQRRRGLGGGTTGGEIIWQPVVAGGGCMGRVGGGTAARAPRVLERAALHSWKLSIYGKACLGPRRRSRAWCCPAMRGGQGWWARLRVGRRVKGSQAAGAPGERTQSTPAALLARGSDDGVRADAAVMSSDPSTVLVAVVRQRRYLFGRSRSRAGGGRDARWEA